VHPSLRLAFRLVNVRTRHDPFFEHDMHPAVRPTRYLWGDIGATPRWVEMLSSKGRRLFNSIGALHRRGQLPFQDNICTSHLKRKSVQKESWANSKVRNVEGANAENLVAASCTSRIIASWSHTQTVPLTPPFFSQLLNATFFNNHIHPEVAVGPPFHKYLCSG
jgi:hypothetical protein